MPLHGTLICFSEVAMRAILALVLLLATPALAQVSSYSMIKTCPEGCRPIDKITSCGSIAATNSCVMAVNGDITMRCNDGSEYTLGIEGCGSATTPPPGDQIFSSGFTQWVESHTQGAQTEVLSILEQVPLARNISLLVFAFLLGIVGIGSLSVLRTVPGFVFGFATGCIATAFFASGADMQSYMVLVGGFGLGFLILLATAVRPQAVGGISGSALFLLGSVMTFAYLSYVNQPVSGVTPFFVVLASIVVGSMVGAALPYLITVISLSLQAAVYGCFGAVHWIWGCSPFDKQLTSGVIAGGTLVICGILQFIWLQQMKKRIKRMKARQALIAQGVDPDEYLATLQADEGRQPLNRGYGTASPPPVVGVPVNNAGI